MQMIVSGKKRSMYLLVKSIFLFSLFSFLFINTACAQQIDLSFKNASLETVFRDIEKKSAYRFIYTREEIKASNPVTIDINNARIETLLERIFDNQPLSYSVNKNYISIHVKDEKKISKTPNGIDVEGVVLNETGEAIGKATITLKDKLLTSATDENGRFKLKDINENSILLISNIGYISKEVSVNGKTGLEIRLSIAIKTLDETVVIGYGRTTQRLNTGSVSKISSRDIGKQPVSNPLAALQGRAPGLTIIQQNGLPGSNFSVQIRGRNSIQSGNSPLFIIDGVPFLSDIERLTQRGQIGANNPFNTINPNDIESIEILKDADATAIYGSLGANGVVLITTKKATSGEENFDVSFYSGIGRVTRNVNFLNTQQYVEMRREAFINDQITPNVANAPDLLLWDTTRYTNWSETLIGGTAHSLNAQLRYAGGNIHTRFSIGANYYNECTIFDSDLGNKRHSVHLNVNHRSLNNRFSLNSSVNYGSDISKLIQGDLTSFINLSPNAPKIYDSLGRLNWSENGGVFNNPYSILLQSYDVTTNRLTGNITGSYQLIKNLIAKVSAGYNSIQADETAILPISSQNPATNPKGSANFGSGTINNWIVEPQLEYRNKYFKKFQIQFLLGSTMQESKKTNKLIDAFDYSDDNLIKSTAGAASLRASLSNSLYRYKAIFSRINLNWDDTYLLNITARRDGSSRFGPGKQFANFGAIGAGWVFSNGSLFRNNISLVSFGKLRASYGITGNDQINNYEYLDTWRSTQFPYQSQPGLQPSRLFNPNYSWEQTRKYEAAIELGLFSNRIFLTTNWFLSKSDNQIVRFTLPAQTGFNSILQNFPGVVQNKGWEVSIKSINLPNKDFSWETNLNLTIPKNELIKFPGLETSSYSTSYLIGKPLNILLGYSYLGINKNTGVYEFEDVNKDNSITPQDFIYQGTTDFKYNGGLQNILSYKKWELDIFFYFVNQKGIHAINNSSNANGTLRNQPLQVFDRWQNPGDFSSYQKFTQSFLSPAYRATFMMRTSSGILTNASFIRLKNLSLAYSFSSEKFKKAGFKNLRFFIQTQNLLTITSYKGAPDPETQTFSQLPPLKMIVLGLSNTF